MTGRSSLMLLPMAVFIVIMYVKLNNLNFAYYKNWVWNPVTSCSHSEDEVKQLLNLTREVHNILDEFGIDHWLMYGSIWGAKRMNGPLPWDNDVDIGFNGEGNFAKLSFSDFFAPFYKKGLIVTNKWIQSGTIKVSKPGLKLTLDLFALYNYNGMMKRTGLESWLFFVNYNYYHTFPAWTVELPLPKARFGNFYIGLPRGDMVILKYLYRDSWYKVDAPTGCLKAGK